jgi:hypothetical protein
MRRHTHQYHILATRARPLSAAHEHSMLIPACKRTLVVFIASHRLLLLGAVRSGYSPRTTARSGSFIKLRSCNFYRYFLVPLGPQPPQASRSSTGQRKVQRSPTVPPYRARWALPLLHISLSILFERGFISPKCSCAVFLLPLDAPRPQADVSSCHHQCSHSSPTYLARVELDVRGPRRAACGVGSSEQCAAPLVSSGACCSPYSPMVSASLPS